MVPPGTPSWLILIAKKLLTLTSGSKQPFQTCSQAKEALTIVPINNNAGRSLIRDRPALSTHEVSGAGELAQHVLQDAAVAEVVGLAGGVDAHDGVE